MAAKLITAAILLLCGWNARAQSGGGQNLPKFMGREVTVVAPDLDVDGLFPKGPASICIEGPPQRQCYTAPKDFGRSPTVELIQVEKDMPALLFSAASGGVSGFGIHFALLQPGARKDLQDMLPADMSLSNQSQHAFWNDSTISAAPILVTAEYVWGPDEGHYGDHRFMVSAYGLKSDALMYYLEDRFMTARKYDLEANANVLASEKLEIIRRLRRSSAESEPRQRH
jgi:hypothetical protein